MARAGYDQSSLARAVGCTPGAINQILLGNTQRSRFLPEIAHELGVSLEWLWGYDAPQHPQGRSRAHLRADEHQLIDHLRELRSQDVRAIGRITAALRAADSAREMELPPEPALARMFEGLLRAMPDGADLDEQALLLARRLPIGLAQLRDLLPIAPAVPDPASRVLAEAGATRDHEPR